MVITSWNSQESYNLANAMGCFLHWEGSEFNVLLILKLKQTHQETLLPLSYWRYYIFNNFCVWIESSFTISEDNRHPTRGLEEKNNSWWGQMSSFLDFTTYTNVIDISQKSWQNFQWSFVIFCVLKFFNNICQSISI